MKPLEMTFEEQIVQMGGGMYQQNFTKTCSEQ